MKTLRIATAFLCLSITPAMAEQGSRQDTPGTKGVTYKLVKMPKVICTEAEKEAGEGSNPCDVTNDNGGNSADFAARAVCDRTYEEPTKEIDCKTTYVEELVEVPTASEPYRPEGGIGDSPGT